jgi:hypothetical protein
MRVQRNDPWLRLRLTALARNTIGLLFGTRVYDANVPFKLVRRDAWLSAAPLIPREALAPSMFLALFLRAGGLSAGGCAGCWAGPAAVVGGTGFFLAGMIPSLLNLGHERRAVRPNRSWRYCIGFRSVHARTMRDVQRQLRDHLARVPRHVV